jgi:hypothetical protein
MAAAGSFALTRVRSDPGNKRPGQLQWRERKGYWGSIGDSTSREGELAVRLQWKSAGSHARPCRAFLWAARGKAVHTASSRRHVRGMGTAWRRAWTEYGGDAIGRATTVDAVGPRARGAWRKGRGPG